MRQRVGAERAADASRQFVEGAARNGEQIIEAGQRASGGAELPAAVLDEAQHGAVEPAAEIVHRTHQLRAHRDRHFGGARRRRRAQIGGEVDQCRVRLVPDGRDQRDLRGRRRAHDDLLVEAPEVLEAATATRHDQHVRARDGSIDGKRVEAGDRGRDLRRRRLALHAHRPDQHAYREAVVEAMQDVADDGAGRRGDDADDARQIGDRPLATGIEQSLGSELAPALLEQRHQRPDAGRLQCLDDDLILRRAREGGQLAGGNDLHPLLGAEAQLAEIAFPDHRLDLGAIVLQREIGVARGMRPAIAGNLAAHAHKSKCVLDGALQRHRDLGDGVFAGVGDGVGQVGRGLAASRRKPATGGCRP